MPDSLDIQALSAVDAPAVQSLLTRSFGAAFAQLSRVDIEATFSDYPYAPISMVGFRQGQVVAFVQVSAAYFHPSTYSLAWLAVAPEQRRAGFGGAMIRHAEVHIKRELLRGNPGSVLLVAAHDPSYFQHLGYLMGPSLFDGSPILIKNI